MNIVKGIGAVLAGIIFIVVTHTGTDLVLEKLGIFTPLGQGFHITWMVVTATIYRSVYTVTGGYLTAALAPHRPMLYAVILGVIGIAASTARSDRDDAAPSGPELVSNRAHRTRAALYLVRRQVENSQTAALRRQGSHEKAKRH